MKKDCAYVRKSLRKYLRGHMFKFEQIKIARHLNACPVCRSEFQALRKVADTKQLLKDVTPTKGIARMKERIGFLAKLRLLVYRPLLLSAIIGIGVLLYLNVIAPQRRDYEIENLEKSVPLSSAVDSEPSVDTAPVPVPAVASVPTQSLSGSSVPIPLIISVSAQNYKGAVQLINDVMQGHAQLRKMRLSNTAREVDGNLTARELLELLHRIKEAGKVSYSRKHFDSFAAGELISFKIKVKQAPSVDQASPAAVDPAAPASAPTSSVR